jgi:hypothetical protein
MNVRTLSFGILFLLSQIGVVQTVRANDRSQVQSELEAILALDQQYRGTNRTGKWEEVAEAQASIDRENLSKVLLLVEAHGWPRISEVGESAALAAFLVIQHADDVEVQERFLPVVSARVKEGEAKGAWFALLTDRIRIRRGQPQLYGTQSRYNAEAGRSQLLPIEAPEKANERRVALGMKPLKGFPQSTTLDKPSD